MSESLFVRARELHAQALGMTTEERAAFLDDACGADESLRQEVESLLDARRSMGDFLGAPAPEVLVELAAPPLEPGASVGAYQVLDAIASGGSGTVYAALQESPRRKVALKVMHAHLTTRSAAERFRAEADVLARMKHPGIATVFEAGVHEVGGAALPWLALEFVDEARPITTYAREEGLSRTQRLELFVRVCDAVHHGHVKGVAHRDLKPGNVLVDGSGRPKLIDFGIASALEDPETEGEVLGTLSYMSPEQCDPDGSQVDARSDVYALGVLLYELLTGALPLDVTRVPLAEALRRIREDVPRSLAAVDRSLKGDLDAITAKALSRHPDARYSSAAALGEDVRRHLTHRPVDARVAGPLYHVSRFARRHSASVVAVAAVVVMSLVAAVTYRQLAVDNDRARREAELEAYVANIAAAEAALQVNDIGEAMQRLEQAAPHLRGWEWFHLRGRVDLSERVIRWSDKGIRTGAVSPDGLLAVVSSAAMKRTYEVALIEIGSGRPLWQHEVERRVDALAFHPDGGTIALGFESGRVEFRDGSGKVLRGFQGHPAAINAVAFDPAGRRLATASRDRTIRVWDAATGTLLEELQGHADRVISLAWGRSLVSGGREGVVRIWSGTSARSIASGEESIEGTATSPDGLRLATASRDFTVRLFEMPSGALLSRGDAHRGNVRDVAFSPDGEIFATASWDRTIRLWRAADGSAIRALRGHSEPVERVAFLSDSRRLASFGRDGTIRVWNTRAQDDVPTLRGHTDAVALLCIRGGAVYSRARNLEPRAWDLATGSPLSIDPAEIERHMGAVRTPRAADWRRLEQQFGHPYGGRRSPDERWIAAGYADGTVRVHDARTLEVRWTLVGHSGGTRALAFSPDGLRLASGSEDRTIRLWDLTTGRQMLALHGHVHSVYALAFSEDGTVLASGDGDPEVPGVVKIWSAHR